MGASSSLKLTANRYLPTQSSARILTQRSTQSNGTEFASGMLSSLPQLELLRKGESDIGRCCGLRNTRRKGPPRLVITDDTGAAVYEASYDPWGNVRASTGTADTDRLYTGQRFDSATGLYYYNARYYDPPSPASSRPTPSSPASAIPRRHTRACRVHAPHQLEPNSTAPATLTPATYPVAPAEL